MSRKRRAMIVAVSWLLSLGVMFYLGIAFGAKEYCKVTRALQSRLDANNTAFVLKLIRQDEIEKAILLLECDLDGSIVEFGAAKKYDEPKSYLIPNFIIFSPDQTEIAAEDGRLMAEVAQYRRQFPSRMDEPTMQDLITRTLKPFEN